MMTLLIVLAAAAQAYLLGSIDTGILVSKCLYHDDVRNHGSGAAGMTNMLRTFGKKAAALTAAGDVLKGVAAVCIGRWLFGFLPADAAVSPYLGVYMTAILAVIGHSKPIYFGFKGGKGVLVAGGAILAIQPILLPFLTAVFLLCLIPTGLALLELDRLMRRIRQGEVFLQDNVRRIRRLIWNCAAVSLICLACARLYPPLLFVTIIMAFLCLVIAVVASIMDAATRLREENDLTI